MKIIFLDIDGVVNSTKSAIGLKGFPHELPEDYHLFDHVALGCIRRICEHGDVKIVLSSTWRKDYSAAQMASFLNLPIIQSTKNWSDKGSERGWEIQDWLDSHPEVEKYVILDDSCDMLPHQPLIRTCAMDGFKWNHFLELCLFFNLKWEEM